MRNVFRSFSAFWVVLLLGCGSEGLVLDRAPPRIVAISPPTALPSQDALIEIAFSEPVVDVQPLERCLVFAKEGALSEAEIVRLSRMRALRSAHKGFALASELVDGGLSLRVHIEGPLSDDTLYRLWLFDCLRDHAGHALVEAGSAFDFRREK